jgi:hypothetical protein
MLMLTKQSVYVSDILLSLCLRRQYYNRLMPAEEQIIDDSQVHAFVRGQASEQGLQT